MIEIPEFGFEIHGHELIELQNKGRVILANRYLRKESLVAPRKTIALSYEDETFAGRVVKLFHHDDKTDLMVEWADKKRIPTIKIVERIIWKEDDDE